MSTIDDVKARLDIVETVRSYVPELKKSGRTWKARCPFHTERTPSFNVDPERQTWHCFGACSTGGDVIEFVRRQENLDFREALRLCAERAGVELRPPTARESEEREQHARLLSANEAAAVFYQAALAGPDGSAARDYTAGRGLDEGTLTTWQLGYAPAGWRTLTDHLVARGFSEADLIEAGLAIESDRGAYDRFRDRLVFPTRDARRRLIGFGARALQPDDEPKYLNTPQTPLFDKSGNLYGLDRAAEAIRHADQAVVVEGYMDVIAAHQFGFENVVASNGTSITEKQMTLLNRYTDNVILFLDIDAAGSAAMQRGGSLAREKVRLDSTGIELSEETPAIVRAERALGGGWIDHDEERTGAYERWSKQILVRDLTMADIRVAQIPDRGDGAKEDPDSLVRKDPKAFQQILANAEPVLDFLFEKAASQFDLANPRDRSRLLDQLMPLLASLKDTVVRSHYVQKAARLGQVDERTVTTLLAQLPVAGRGAVRPRPVATSQEVTQAKRQPAAPLDGEAQLLQLLLCRNEARSAGIALDPATFEDSANRALFVAWVADAHLDERADDLDQPLRERYADLRTAAIRDYDPRHIAAMVTDIAQRLRMARAAARLRTVAVDQARTVQAARLDRGEEALAVAAEAVDEFNETVRRQRALTREYRVATHSAATPPALAASGRHAGESDRAAETEGRLAVDDDDPAEGEQA